MLLMEIMKFPAPYHVKKNQLYIYIYSASIIKFPVNWLMSTTPRDLFEGFFFSILFQNPGYDFGVSLITPCIVGFS